jgi:glycosyltransferase involved in cell wall biosynthesis
VSAPRPEGVSPLRHVLNEIRRPLPLRPLEELVDRFLNREVLRVDAETEAREVAAYLAANGPVPYAEVVTVVATYKRRDLVARAVRSALAQEGVPDHRVVVVDDGGGELDLIPDDPRVTVVSLRANTHNAGLVRNVGLRVSRSRYIAFLDDDNIWLQGHLATSLAALGAGAALTYTGVTVVDGLDHEVSTWMEPWDRYRMRVVNYIDLNAIAAVRADRRYGPDGLLLSRLRRRPRSPRYEDWELVWRVSRHGRVEHVPVNTVRYRLSEHSSFRGDAGIGGD